MTQVIATRTELQEQLAALHAEHCVLLEKSTELEGSVYELSRFFSQSLDMMCVATMDGYFKRLNVAWTTQLGWSVDELLAKPFMEFVHPDDSELTADTLNTLNVGVKTVMFENRYRHKDGSYRWMQWNAQPEPETEVIFAVARDITRQRELEREILTIADREKEHLGQELHDGVCQTLAGIAALSITLARSVTANTNISRTATEINLLLNSAVRDTRDLARGLDPVGLIEDGLQRALEILTNNVQHLFRVGCKLQCSTPFNRLQPDIEKQLFRITQEAINNSIAHGHASRIVVTLGTFGKQGQLSISDDGVGLGENVGRGMGLHTMNYRARLINGRLHVHTRSSGGSKVSCRFPIVSRALAKMESVE